MYGKHKAPPGGNMDAPLQALRLASVLVVDYEMTPPVEMLGDPVHSGFEEPEGVPLAGWERDVVERRMEKVPVLRVFGRGEKGESVLVRVHGALPYIYVPWPGEWDHDSPEAVRKKLLEFCNVIEDHPATGAPPVLHSAFLVQGIPFFGYHPAPRLFIKLFLVNPKTVTPLAAVLGTKSILNLRHQPYHAHFPYIMQCMVDLGLAGMSPMNIGACTPCCPKNSETEIAVDCKAPDVLNRHRPPILHDDLRSSDALLVSTLTDVWAELAAYRKEVLREQNVTQKQTMGSPFRDIVPEDDPVQKVFRNALSQLRRNVSEVTQTAAERLIPPTPKQDLQGVPWCDSTYEELAAWIPTQHSRHVETMDSCDEGDMHSTLDALRDLRHVWQDQDAESDPELGLDTTSNSSDEAEVAPVTALSDGTAQSPDLLGDIFRSETLDRSLDGGLGDLPKFNIPSTQFPAEEAGSNANPIEVPNMTQVTATPVPSTPETEVLFSKPTSLLKETPQVINIRHSVGDKRPRSVEKELFPDSESSQGTKIFSLSTHHSTQSYTPCTDTTEPLFASTPKQTVRFTELPQVSEQSPAESSVLATLHPKDKRVLAATAPPPTVEDLMATSKLPEQPVIAMVREAPSVLRLGNSKRSARRVIYEPAMPPPTAADLEDSVKVKEYEKHLTQRKQAEEKPLLSLLTQATAMASKGAAQPMHKGRSGSAALPYLLVASLEVLAECRASHPDPTKDKIDACCIRVHNVNMSISEEGDKTCLVVVGEGAVSGVDVVQVPNEEALVVTVLRLLRKEDPDILLGWDVQRYSYGYLNRRAALYGVNVAQVLGRVVGGGNEGLAAVIPEGMRSESDNEMFRVVVNVKGRVLLNLWRTLRSELKLSSYTLSAVAKAALGVTVPKISARKLSEWAAHADKRPFALRQLVNLTALPLRVANHLDLVNRTVELSRLYGVQFTDIVTRGSQFRVENMFTRLAVPLHFVMITPSKVQVERQNRQEGVPLVMEPHSGYYTDPVIVLDFRSLYPSIVIAYNLCFSTCLGKHTGTRGKKIGPISNYKIPKEFLEASSSADVTIAPNSCAFVKSKVRRGVFPRLLSEILSTRFAVQESLKKARGANDKVMEGILNARQVGLKMIANVTYGYTAATMSGRMPCSDIADAIVLLARKTLETTIRDVEANAGWRAKVVYGDTDSLFVCLPGATVSRAFEVGREIVAHVAAHHPSPIKLKLEKVYSKSMLVTKKRYVGYAHDTPTSPPVFEAKGVECIRRDQCRTTQKIQEMALRTLFDTSDMSAVQRYVERQLVKVQAGDVNVHDLILRQEVKLGTYANPNQLPPSATVAREMMKRDKLAEPLYNERVPYVVINSPAARLSDLVMHPLVLLSERDPTTTVNATYYITKQICPPLERVLGLAGGDVKGWVAGLPKVRTHGVASALVRSVGCVAAVMHQSTEDEAQEIIKCATREARAGTSNTLHSYYSSTLCIVCKGDNAPPGKRVCTTCASTPDVSRYTLSLRRHHAEVELQGVLSTCESCMGTANVEYLYSCNSLDCEVPWRRQRAALSVRDAAAACAVAW